MLIQPQNLAHFDMIEAPVKTQASHKDTLIETTLMGEPALTLERAESMPPFLMYLISDSDSWAFIGSQNAITAGRRNSNHSLFPYYTQDKLFDMAMASGSTTRIEFTGEDGAPEQWTVFKSGHGLDEAKITRSVIKSISGTKIAIEEYHEELGLRVRVTWTSAKNLGIVRHVSVENCTDKSLQFSLTDGFLNILPGGVDRLFQNEYSILADAYKRTELCDDRFAAYSLSSVPTDKAEPNEGMTASIAWACGFDSSPIYLAEEQLDMAQPDSDIRARRGCYLLKGDCTLGAGESTEHWIVAEPDLPNHEVANRLHWVKTQDNLDASIRAAIAETPKKIMEWVGALDGVQKTNSMRSDYRHFSNTLFNMMRGGALPNGYGIPMAELLDHVKKCNSDVYSRNEVFLKELPELMAVDACATKIADAGDPDLLRLATEYLPFAFSRRHGDPSRPWNHFNIHVNKDDGSINYAYQGNWRDIFQNWESSIRCYPAFFDGAISRFLNATTADGYNPYRINTDTFEWERPEPDSPWSNIGYWGDHQIIYLLKLLETRESTAPGSLSANLNHKGYAFARIPYKMKGFGDVKANPRDTIEYDDALSDAIDALVEKKGYDGQLLHDANGEVVYATLFQKLLIPVVEKLTHFVPEAGIWMNTQRPEWNDANNALAGYGASVVTLGYIHRYLNFLIQLLETTELDTIDLLEDQPKLVEGISEILTKSDVWTDATRYVAGCELGELGAEYREKYYNEGVGSNPVSFEKSRLLAALVKTRDVVAASLRSNKRSDDLYHSYNLIRWKDDSSELSIGRLSLMLEGQVSILSAQLLEGEESVVLLKALKSSDLYRADQDSYILYPNKELPGFLQKGLLPDELEGQYENLKSALGEKMDVFLKKAADGKIRFASELRNMECLDGKMDEVGIDASVRKQLADLYESTFNHHAFTGRSGTFFAYEGLGSIYWHMVSKLLLAAYETWLHSHQKQPGSGTTAELAELYYQIKKGIGADKTPAEYGAFPTDAYSHTPAHTGVQQPGMTGQVKEDILSRFGELGVQLTDGKVKIDPALLRKEEFVTEATEMIVTNLDSTEFKVAINSGELGFTVCGVPFVYHLAEKSDAKMKIQTKEGSSEKSVLELDESETRTLFGRTGHIERVDVFIHESQLA
jgi:hypothetical protein